MAICEPQTLDAAGPTPLHIPLGMSASLLSLRPHDTRPVSAITWALLFCLSCPLSPRGSLQPHSVLPSNLLGWQVHSWLWLSPFSSLGIPCCAYPRSK